MVGVKIFIPKQINHTRTEFKAKTKKEKVKGIRDKKEGQSWGDSLGPAYSFLRFYITKGIYRMFLYTPLHFFNSIGHFIGHFILGTSRKVKRRTKAGLRALHPNYSEKSIRKLCDASSKYMGSLMMDIFFNFPLIVHRNGRKNISLKHFERFEAAIAQGKGVIITTPHVGQFFHANFGLVCHPNHYKVSTIGSIKNIPMYEYNNRERYDNFYIYGSTSFSFLAPHLTRDLKNNHSIVVYHDYASSSQLRAPCLHGKLPYLIHTPQSFISLHKKTGAVILPAICHPNGPIGRTTLEFLDNTAIMQASKDYMDKPDKEFHGHVSTEINKVVYNQVRRYAHIWEEIMKFTERRVADKINFPPNHTMKQFLEDVLQKMHSILDKSFEPDRKDAQLHAVIDEIAPKIVVSLQNPDRILRPHKTFIDLSLMDGVSELLKLCSASRKELVAKEERVAGSLFLTLSEKLSKFILN
ncbi:LpxL/LpxP family acyltransferase [Candidatus Lokiarchaeum ossiferum]|uniref:LpxL/LpxP family acyltransferase n=1 Tax=Candidatus Lokiarchaeum ossiferum TaxID=2951803 RepID=UPI00352DA7DA